MEQEEYRRMADVTATHWWYRSTRELLRQVLGDRVGPGRRVLDAGAGTGSTGGWLVGSGAEVVAADMEPLALALYREARRPVGAAVADVRRLPFADESFDVVLCVTVLCHRSIERPQEAVAELARLVRPGGSLCLMEPGVAWLHRAHDRVTHSARRFSRRGLGELVVGAGLELERATGAYSFLVPPAAVKAVVEQGKVASDLDQAQDGLRGLLPAAASLERRWLSHHDLPVGLSVLGLGRKG